MQLTCKVSVIEIIIMQNLMQKEHRVQERKRMKYQ